MRKILDFLKKWAVEGGFIAVGLLLLFLPTPLPVRTFGLGLLFSTVLNPLVKYIIKRNTEK